MSFTRDAINKFLESQIFFPDPYLIMTPRQTGLDFEDVWFTTSDDTRLHGWWVPASADSPVLLFCHGNAGNISHRVDNIKRLHDAGLNVFIFDYRGYGQSGGRITEDGFYLDADAAYQEAAQYAKEGSGKLVIFGRSLGGVAATSIASRRPCSGVILESTFTHMGDMAAQHYPIPGLGGALKGRLNSLDRMPSISAPILFFHGDADDLVPIKLGRALFDRAVADKEFVTLKTAGHNDTYLVGGQSYFRKIKSFADSLRDIREMEG